jgi:hypothetical protein
MIVTTMILKQGVFTTFKGRFKIFSNSLGVRKVYKDFKFRYINKNKEDLK